MSSPMGPASPSANWSGAAPAVALPLAVAVAAPMPMAVAVPVAVAAPTPMPMPVQSSTPFSPSAFLTNKYADAKTAVGQVSLSFDSMSSSASQALDGLSSPVRAQVDAALSRANQELRARLTAVEAELRAKAARVDAELAMARAELVANFERQRGELMALAEQRVGEARAAVLAEVSSKLADLEQLKQRLQNRALEEFERMLMSLLDEKILPVIQSAAIDPLMPLFVQRLIRDAIRAVWPDVKEEIFHVWHGMVLTYEPVEAGQQPDWCPNFPRAAVASFLYHTFPFDRSVWWQIRRPMWWFWNLVALCPFYGVQAAYFIFLFLALDKGDEYQMVNFILQFKGLQFVTLGLLNCVVGSASYYRCVGVDYAGDRWDSPPIRDGSTRLYLHDCNVVGPGALPGFYTDMILFLLQGFTVWIAMGLLPSTVKKGVRQLAAGSPPRRFQSGSLLDQVETAIPKVLGFSRAPVYGGMGGKLRQMIFFDALVLLLLCGLATLLLFTRPYSVLSSGAFARHEWLFKQDVFWLKTLYGLLSLPFVVFLLPVVSNLLLHVRPTGYNRAGQCVPLHNADEGTVPEALQSDLPDLDEIVRRGEAGVAAVSGALGLRVSNPGQVGQHDDVPPVGLAWPPGDGSAADQQMQQLQIAVHPAQAK